MRLHGRAILLESCMCSTMDLCKYNLLGPVMAIVLIPAPRNLAGDNFHSQTLQELSEESGFAQSHTLFLCNQQPITSHLESNIPVS